MPKTLQWNRLPVARASTWGLDILWRHFYGLKECTYRNAVDLLKEQFKFLLMR